MRSADATQGRDHGISLRDATRVWARIAALSFGGPAGQIAVMHRILVEEKKWIGEERFLHALNYCMLLPGPGAQQLATYIGWLLHKTKGGIIAGALFILPGFLAIMALSWIYALYGSVGPIEGIFFGLKAAVLAIVLEAVRRIGSRALRNGAMRLTAAVAFIAIFAFAVPFPLIIAAAAAAGWTGARLGLHAFATTGGGHRAGSGKTVADAETALGEAIPPHARPNLRWSLKVASAFLILWLSPVVGLVGVLGGQDVYSRIGIFFSQMAVVTFGGAYAVLAYVAQEAVQTYGWLRAGEMLDGLGMAETTPGPLIIVTQFVGFMGAFRSSGSLHPLLAGTLGGLLTTWVTFTPCFLWIFLGAPFIERMRGNQALAGALSTITAAVVGVVLNLATWFAVHTLFGEVLAYRAFGLRLDVPVLNTIRWFPLLLAAAAVVAIFRFRVTPVVLLSAAALAGLARWALSVL